MISDILFFAEEDIRRYLDQYPDVYKVHQTDLEALCAMMAQMRTALGNSFVPAPADARWRVDAPVPAS